MTNSPAMRNVIASCDKLFEYVYEVKVFGRFSDEKLLKIRTGAVIKGVKMGPFFVR